MATETKEQLQARMKMLAANSGSPKTRKMPLKECVSLIVESRKEKRATPTYPETPETNKVGGEKPKLGTYTPPPPYKTIRKN